jgi:RNA polymerase sigma factor (sigma-70 family)
VRDNNELKRMQTKKQTFQSFSSYYLFKFDHQRLKLNLPMFAKFDLGRTIALSPGKSAELDDATLWQRFRAGNDLAFSILYKKYVQRLFNYGMHTCYDREIVLDCLQELFGRLWDKRNHLAEVELVHSYLYKSFRRLLLNKLNQNRRRALMFLKPEVRGFEILSSFEDAIILEETSIQQLELLRKAIGQLSKRQREVIFLKFYNELNYSEVAVVMEMGVDAVYNLMSKAIDSLRTVMKNAVRHE